MSSNRNVHDIPSGVNAEPAAQWGPAQPSPHSGYRRSVSTHFSFPASLHTLFFLSRGSVGGNINLITDSSTPASEIKVTGTVYYADQSVLQYISINKVSRRDGYGVGIFTPNNWNVNPRPLITVDVVLPASLNLPLNIPNIEADLTAFSVAFGELRGAVNINSVSVNTYLGNVDAKTLFSRTLSAHTNNGSISGSYSSPSTISLTSNNGRVSPNVSLEHPGDHSTLELNTTSSNGDVAPTISLSSARGSGGIFNILASTNRGNTSISFTAAPIDSTTNITATTHNGMASAVLHPTFEGTIAASTNLGSASLQRTHAADPSGRGRQRDVKANQSRNYINGTVYWIPVQRANPVGSVNVTTSLGSVSLTI